MIFSLHQGGVVMPSDNTHTIIKIHPLSNLLDTWALIFSSCTIFTVYPNRIMHRHPSPLQVITTKAREDCPKEHSAKKKWPSETHSVTYVPGHSTLSDLSRLHRHASVAYKATFKIFIQHYLGLHRTHPSLTSAINTLLAFWPYGTHPFFPQAQIILIFSDLLKSLTPFLFQLTYSPLHS